MTTKQFGFRPHRSTQDVLNIMTNYAVNNSDRRLKTLLVTKDVEKAFDTVWHAGLKFKIFSNFDLPPVMIKLLCSFLDDRKLYLKFLGKLSECVVPQAGVVQGSPLSPTIFNMFTSDLPDPIHDDSLTLLYADDCTHLTRFRGVDGAVRRMNMELDAVSHWEQEWRIKTNREKTQALFINPRRCTDAIDRVYLNSFDQRPLVPLRIVENCTVLGLTFDKHLRFHKQTAQKQQIARLALGSLYRFSAASHKTKRHLYQALVKPHLTYAPLPLSLAAPTNQHKLQIIQNNALRWIQGVSRLDCVPNSVLHEETKNTPALNILWSQQTSRQLARLEAWCEDWAETSRRLVRTGPWRVAWARNFLEMDFLADTEPRY